MTNSRSKHPVLIYTDAQGNKYEAFTKEAADTILTRLLPNPPTLWWTNEKDGTYPLNFPPLT